jgi:nucleotide-binding universal stress UspA family protein
MLKNLMVHLDASTRAEARLRIAIDLAKSNNARLVGVFGQRASAKKAGPNSDWPPESYELAAKASKEAFDQATIGLTSEWVDINRGSDSAILSLVTEKARYFDLVIMGQHNADAEEFTVPDLVEEVLSNSGRPVLIIPYIGDFVAKFKRPLLAWNASRESAHALNDAIPLIKGCDEAIILSFDSSIARAEESCREVQAQLSCHSIFSRSEVMVIEDVGVMDMLLNNACDQGSDLLVMGSHSQLGFPFLSRGAGTRHILRTMVLPVLMSG